MPQPSADDNKPDQLPPYLGEVHEAQEPEPFTGGRLLLKRALIVLAVIGFVVLLIVLPPLVNVSRYQRRIAASMGSTLGRPVHMNSVTLNLLPMPGFTLENFVVEEDPAFGSEPIIRANSVRATLRFSSLWHRRVEFSRIALTDPSVNLVHLPDGRWNINSILVQASRISAAPTAQKQRTLALRFPYIEATGARLNLKMGGEKTPYSLTDADFALWLPEPDEWHLRLEAHPARTDTSVSDTGALRIDGTLGRAATFDAVPVDLTGEWRKAPLGSVSLIALGRDMGLRGDVTLAASVHGTVAQHAATARLHVTGLRRADFVPEQPLTLDIACSATAIGVFHALNDIRCAWPPREGELQPAVSLSGSLPDVWHPGSATGELKLTAAPASALVQAMRAISRRIPGDLSLGGTLDGSVTRANGTNTGTITLTKERLALGETVFAEGETVFHGNGNRVVVEPVAMNLGAREPLSISGEFDPHGYQFSVQGMVLPARLKAFATAFPQLGDGWIGTISQPNSAQTSVPVNVRIARTWSGEPAVFELPAKQRPARRRHAGR